MEALILSCSTGGGHNAAGRALKEELERRGHRADFLDPYTLAGGKWDRRVGNTYVQIAQKTPRVFGAVYHLGDLYRNLPIPSPVYGINLAMCRIVGDYLKNHSYDIIFTPHIFPGEILQGIRKRGVKIPPVVFISTDYTCSPFTEETKCDYYITPGPMLNGEYVRRGIPRERLRPFGIPVKRAFSEEISREKAIEELGLDPGKTYLLLSGGSIGAGQQIQKTIEAVADPKRRRKDEVLIVICGNNEALYRKLEEKYGRDPGVILMTSTDRMELYLKACSVYLSKPGGLSSTEAAVAGIPLIHISPIPGCETKNLEYFGNLGMCIPVGNETEALPAALERLRNPEEIARMREHQRKYISASAAEEICTFAESITNGR